MKLTIEIDMALANFTHPQQIAGILHNFADRTLDATEEMPWDGIVIIEDCDGNTVGSATMEEDGE